MDKKSVTLRVLARIWAQWSSPGRINRGKMLSLNFEKYHSLSFNLPKSKEERYKVSAQQSLKIHDLHSMHASCLKMNPLHVVITGAAGQIGYSLIYMIGHGDVFGMSQPLFLHLLDIPAMMGVLKGVVMEVNDCAFPLVRGIVATDDPAVAFKDVEAAFLVGAMPRKEGMERKDLLAANAKIFKVQGQMLDKHAKKTVQIIIVGNPNNTNALICSMNAPSIPPENIHAMTRLDQNRAQSQIAIRLGIPPIDVKNVVVWGNHSSTQFPDASHAMVNIGGQTVKAVDAIKDNTWLTTEFVKTVQTRGGAVIAARKLSSAMSAAKAAGDHMRDIWSGTPEGIYVSMAVISDGSYGAPKGVFFSYPVTIKNKQWKIVQGLPIDDFGRCMLDNTGKELIQERKDALAVIGQ